MLAPQTETGPEVRVRETAPDGSDSNHAHLRRSTRHWHHLVDAQYTRFDLSRREDLANFLLQQAPALPALERAIAESGATTLLANWKGDPREAVLTADLAQLGLVPPPSASAPDLPTGLHGVGALYVLEGAKLGGRVLLRQVESSPDPRVRASGQFLRQFDSGRWRAFLADLNGLPSDADSRADLVAGAVAAFAAFLPPAEQPIGVGSPIRRPGSGLVQLNEA